MQWAARDGGRRAALFNTPKERTTKHVVSTLMAALQQLHRSLTFSFAPPDGAAVSTTVAHVGSSCMELFTCAQNACGECLGRS